MTIAFLAEIDYIVKKKNRQNSELNSGLNALLWFLVSLYWLIGCQNTTEYESEYLFKIEQFSNFLW